MTRLNPHRKTLVNNKAMLDQIVIFQKEVFEILISSYVVNAVLSVPNKEEFFPRPGYNNNSKNTKNTRCPVVSFNCSLGQLLRTYSSENLLIFNMIWQGPPFLKSSWMWCDVSNEYFSSYFIARTKCIRSRWDDVRFVYRPTPLVGFV